MPRGNHPTRLGSLLAAGSIAVAPFIALIYRAEVGLLVMAIALGAVSLLLQDARKMAPQSAQTRLRLVVGFNLVLIVACVALAGWLATR